MLLLTRLQLTDIDSRYSIYTMVNIQDRSLFIKYSKDCSLFDIQMTPHRTVRWRHRTNCEFLHHRGHHSIYAGPYDGDIGRTASSFTTEGTTLSMQDRTVAPSDGLRVPSPQRAPLYLCRTVRWRHRTDCEFIHRRGHHSIYAGPYGGDIGRTASSFTTEGTTLSIKT